MFVLEMAMIHVVVLALVFVSLMICSTRADEKLDRMKDDIKELHRRYTDLRMNDQNEEAEALRSEMESLVRAISPLILLCIVIFFFFLSSGVFNAWSWIYR